MCKSVLQGSKLLNDVFLFFKRVIDYLMEISTE